MKLLQSVAARCNVLQCVAVYRSVWLIQMTWEENSYLQVPGSIPAETWELRSIWIWDDRPSSKGSKLLFSVMKANQINVRMFVCLRVWSCVCVCVRVCRTRVLFVSVFISRVCTHAHAHIHIHMHTERKRGRDLKRDKYTQTQTCTYMLGWELAYPNISVVYICTYIYIYMYI